MRSVLVALFALASCAAAQATPLTPADKASLISGTNNSCLENQVKDATNCYATAFAEVMSVEDLDKNKDSLTPEIKTKAGELSQKCAASSLKK
jgi:hypothetical protein